MQVVDSGKLFQLASILNTMNKKKRYAATSPSITKITLQRIFNFQVTVNEIACTKRQESFRFGRSKRRQWKNYFHENESNIILKGHYNSDSQKC